MKTQPRQSQMALNLYGLQFSTPESRLTKSETEIYDLIPEGKENAVPLEYIANESGTSPRTVIRVVRQIRLKSLDIGSSRDLGYYRFKDPQEYLEYMAIATKEQARRNQVLTAMRHTPMAQSLMADLNEREKKNEKIHD